MIEDGEDGLETGMYLVGREGDAVDPFFVRMLDDGSLECHETLEALMDHAQLHPGWWWHRMGVPSTMPESFDHLPVTPEEPGECD